MDFEFGSAINQDTKKNIYYLLKKTLPEFEKKIKTLQSGQQLVANLFKYEVELYFPIMLSGSLREGFPLDWDDKYDADLLCPLPGLDLIDIDLDENFHHHPLAPAYLNITIPKEHVFQIFEVLPIKQNLIGLNPEGTFFFNSKQMWENWDEFLLPLFNCIPFTTHIFAKSKNQVAFQIRLIFDKKFRKIAKLNQEIMLPICLKFIKLYELDFFIPEQHLTLVINSIEMLGDEFLDIDFIPCIQCSNRWPPIAMPWIDRHRYWPSQEIIKNIIDQGFHIVFKSCDEYQNRLSFSFAELSLFDNLSITQRIVFYLWKAFYYWYLKLKKSYIKTGEQGIFLEKDETIPDNIITSYHIKTTFFWFAEESLPEIWNQSNVFEKSIESLLLRLLDYVKNENLPHYFIPAHNLFYNGKEGSELTSSMLKDAAVKIEYILNKISNEEPDIEWSNVLNDINITVRIDNISRINIYIFAFIILGARNYDGKLIIDKTNDIPELD